MDSLTPAWLQHRLLTQHQRWTQVAAFVSSAAIAVILLKNKAGSAIRLVMQQMREQKSGEVQATGSLSNTDSHGVTQRVSSDSVSLLAATAASSSLKLWALDLCMLPVRAARVRSEQVRLLAAAARQRCQRRQETCWPQVGKLSRRQVEQSL